MTKIIALIVAAGRSNRMSQELPKQYLTLGNQTVLQYSIACFKSHPKIHDVAVAINPDHEDIYNASTKGVDLLPWIAGGDERADTVSLSLDALKNPAPDFILIHDAARPFIDHNIIDRVIGVLETGHKAAIPAVAVSDTIKQCEGQTVKTTLDRTKLKRIQTPQGFDYSYLLDLYNQHTSDKLLAFTDDAAIIEASGGEVTCVEGSAANFKITTNDDFVMAQALVNNSNQTTTRIGSGFDVHRFCPPHSPNDNHIKLFGIAVPCERSLEGHSDADVGLHALVDALLGGIGAGDIGQHFPPSDDSLKGKDSAFFVNETLTQIQKIGAIINNVDITLICEEPKIGAHRDAMRDNVAKLLDIPLSCVNIKATTTEKLGFTGRGEGIAAQAVASLQMPTKMKG